ncbi:MAG TPA: ubiquinol-cytochrome C chaperone family protein [Allosphingosinicella sp.]|nr:ubiquinol-cytochrome C chaperone family protein [Allosphingosinicella sp.]
MSFLTRIFGDRRERFALDPLYRAIVAAGRDPSWYREEGQVPDTLDGRFDVIASLLALVLLRIEREGGDDSRRAAVLLTEVFIDDMDGTVRQMGIGDQVVGKHVGRMMSALGGRLAAYREAQGDEAAFAAAVRRNVFRDSPASEEAAALVAGRIASFRDALDRAACPDLLAGRLPQR